MTTSSIDWRLPEHRREAFQRFYTFHLKYRSHPGCVYFLLPDLADIYSANDDDRAWMVWLNGNTQNPVTTEMLLEVAPTADDWPKAVAFWNEHFKNLEWDTDRRHQKSRFAEATERWYERIEISPASDWAMAAADGWDGLWGYARSQPYMGRLSAWSMSEYARILLPEIPDASTLLLHDKKGSQSHRNGLALVAGHDSVYWDADTAFTLGIVDELEELGESLLQEAIARNPHLPWVSRLTLESALCTYKSWHKPNRRYPNVYVDMHYHRIRRAERRLGRSFPHHWAARSRHLPEHLLLEHRPNDPGLATVKQNHYLETGEVIMMEREWDDMQSSFAEKVEQGAFGARKDKK